MKDTYTTRQGQTWDDIALEVYGAERHADYLMANNFSELDTLVFSSGTVLKTPELPTEQSGDLPPWRTVVTETSIDPYD
ncbi:MAG: hypothetical protein LUD72_05765 [Bacteroidales bacterium]|nr:hypothetical protein [Bacteroidales bacterium]